MKTYFRNPFLVASVLMLVMAAIFFLFPVNIFDGEVTLDNGVRIVTIKRPIALCYFLGIVSDGDSLDGVLHIRLLTKGYVMAVLLIAGFPALIGYRVWLGNESRKRDREAASAGKSKEQQP